MYKSNQSPVEMQCSRLWAVTLIDDESNKEIKINVESPRLKVFKKFNALDDSSSVEDVVEILSEILSKNREKKKISIDYLLENLDFQDMSMLINDFADWLGNLQKN